MRRKTPKATYFFTQTEHNILKSVCAYMIGVSNDTGLEIPVITIDAFVQQLPKPLQETNPSWVSIYSNGVHRFSSGNCVSLHNLTRLMQSST